MEWLDVVAITTSWVMAIHMGLVDAILLVFKSSGKRVPIITCPKCATFWSILVYLVLTRQSIILSVATSFLASYCAIWLDLLLGVMDMLYEYIYKRISDEEKTA